jgi:hypothetical protein
MSRQVQPRCGTPASRHLPVAVFEQVEKAKRFRDASPLKRIEMQISDVQTEMDHRRGGARFFLRSQCDVLDSGTVATLHQQHARLVSQSSCTRCSGTEPSSSQRRPRDHGDGDRIELRQGATPEGGSRRRRGFCCMRLITGRLRFQPSRPAPSLPHQAPASAQRTQASQGVDKRMSPLTH